MEENLGRIIVMENCLDYKGFVFRSNPKLNYLCLRAPMSSFLFEPNI